MIVLASVGMFVSSEETAAAAALQGVVLLAVLLLVWLVLKVVLRFVLLRTLPFLLAALTDVDIAGTGMDEIHGVEVNGMHGTERTARAVAVRAAVRARFAVGAWADDWSASGGGDAGLAACLDDVAWMVPWLDPCVFGTP